MKKERGALLSSYIVHNHFLCEHHGRIVRYPIRVRRRGRGAGKAVLGRLRRELLEVVDIGARRVIAHHTAPARVLEGLGLRLEDLLLFMPLKEAVSLTAEVGRAHLLLLLKRGFSARTFT
jgi:hypothetical protein